MRDIRQSVRRLLRDWRFTVAAILILGLGIGVNTAVFTVVNTVLFGEQSLIDQSRLVNIYQNGPDGQPVGSSYPAYLDIAQYTDVFSDVTAVGIPGGVSYQSGNTLRTAIVEHTTANYLSVFELRPFMGRWFDAEEDTVGTPLVAVLTHQAWTRKFESDPSIIGRTIRIEGVPVTIVGVGPADHNFTMNIGVAVDFWLPVSSIRALGGSPRSLERQPDEFGFFVKARLRDGVTVGQAQAAMDSLGIRLASEFPNEDAGRGITVLASRDVRVHPQMDALLAPLALVLLSIVGLVLAIACSNLATLLLVRATVRAKEMSIRLAVGASRGQLVRNLLIESVLLSLAGGIVGCLLSWWGVQSLRLIELPIAIELSLDYRVLTFAMALALITGVAFGLAPALKATKIDLWPALRDGESRPPDRWLSPKNVLVVFQVSTSVLLMAGMSFFLQMAGAASRQEPGFAVNGVAMIQTDARYAGYSQDQSQVLYENFRDEVAATPGVQAAVLTRGMPMDVTGIPVVIEGNGPTPDAVATPGSIWAGPGYFDALQIPLLFGRDFDARDGRDAPQVVLINESMARQYFGTVNAVGRRFRFQPEASPWLEVIGVVQDTGTSDVVGDFVDPTPFLFYRSFTQSDLPPNVVLARTSLDATDLVGIMQRQLRGVDPTLPVMSAKTMTQHLEDALTAPRTVATFLGILGLLGIVLAGVGLYAVIAYAVSRRSREIGIRMALGAKSRQVVWAVAREVAMLVGAGTIVGLTLSIVASLVLRQVNIATTSTSFSGLTADPLSLLAIAGFVAFVGFVAAFVPARRAARMNPLSALRYD